ncbi:MAG: response regulator [Desulfobacteraceae bacterium]|nr:response regulator [Desulfobacteraceae bacterium]
MGKILLVDDEPVFIEVGQKVLEALGHEVTAEMEADRALEIFRSRPGEFDLVITDYAMPQITGMDFAGEILRIRPRMPIIICTGFSEKATRESASEMGVELLMKPFGMKQLSNLIGEMLESPRDRHPEAN